MATIRLKTPRRLAWQETDRVQLVLGSENAPSLAASTPAGGEVVTVAAPWGGGYERGGLGAGVLGEGPLGFSTVGWPLGSGELGYGTLGIDDAPRLGLEHRHDPADVCAVLPVGIRLIDANGNQGDVVERLVGLADHPRGVRDAAVADAGAPNTARVSWTASPHV